MKTKNQLTALIALAFTVMLLISLTSCTKTSSSLSKAHAVSSDNSIDPSLRSSLVAWYTFDGDLLDHSGKNNNITFNGGATPTTGKKGLANTAYYFSGNNYMSVPNSSSLNPLKGITLAAVIKPTGFYQGACHRNNILYKAYDDNTSGKYLLAFDDMAYYNWNGCNKVAKSKFQNFFGSYGDGQATAAGARDTNYLKANKWYTVVFTYDGVTAKVYVDGVLRVENTASTTFTPSTAPLYIGGHDSFQYPYWFTGIMDEIRIYNKALSVSAVQKISVLN